MKTKIVKYFLPLGFGLTLSAMTLIVLISVSIAGCNIEQCTDPDFPLYCSSADKCCPSNTPYTDGHGTCYGTLDSCRASGYSCEHCWEE